MTKSRFTIAILGALALVAGALLWLQRQSTEALRTEIVLLREQKAELNQVRAENARLKGALISEADLARLRADRAAVLRLRGEIERTRKDLDQQERALAEQAAEAKTVKLAMNIGADGEIMVDGAPLDEPTLRRVLGDVPSGSRVQIDLYPSGPVQGGLSEKTKELLRRISPTLMSRDVKLHFDVKRDAVPQGEK